MHICIKYVCTIVFQIVNLTKTFSNLTSTDQINKTDSIVKTLANITTPDDVSQYPQELSAVVNIISSINK